MLNSYLEKLHQKIDACAHPNADKEVSSNQHEMVFNWLGFNLTHYMFV